MVNVNKLLTKRKVNFNSRIVEHNTSVGQFSCPKVKYLPLVTEEQAAMNPVNKMSLLESPGVGMHRNIESWQLLQGNGSDPGLIACMESISSDRSGNNMTELQKIMESNVSPGANSAVSAILEQVQQLSDEQKLFLYLKLPTTATPLPGLSTPSTTNGGLLLSPGTITQQQPPNFGAMAENVKNRSEDQFTITWIRTHLELDPKVSLLKEEVYNEYEHYCTSKGVKSQGRADFGKLMKQVFPNLKPRRLGQRGASRYCYSGLRKTNGLRDPEGTEIFSMRSKDSDSWWNSNGSNTPAPCNDSIRGNVNYCALNVVLEWAEKTLSLSPAEPKESGVNIKIERKNSGEYASPSEDTSAGEFSTLLDLASALVRDKRVDHKSYHAAIIAKIASEGNCEVLRFSSDDNSRYQLQKKMQEKDQKRKLHDVIPGVQLAQPTTRTVQKVRRKSSCSSGASSRNPSGDSAVSNTSGDSAVSNTSGDSIVSNSSGVSSLSSTSSLRMSTEIGGPVIVPYNESSCNPSSSVYNGFRALVDVKPNIESISNEQTPESCVSTASSIAGSVITTISNGAKVNNQMVRPQVLNLNQQIKITEEKKNIISLKNEMITKFVANSADNYVNNCTNFTPARLTKDNLQKLNLGGGKHLVKTSGLSDTDVNSSHSFRNSIRQIDSSGAPNVTVSDGMFFVPQTTDISSQASVSRQQKTSNFSAVMQKEERLEEEAEKQDQLSILRQVLPYYLPLNQIKQAKGATHDNRCLNNSSTVRDKSFEFTSVQQGNGTALNSYRNINSHCNTADTSANASPFTSPQMTPQHPRSRHNSGQATTYVTPRSTPYTPQDDGYNPGYSCSSVLTSNTTPFVSPATTPQCSRSRHNSSQGHRLHPNGGLLSTSSIGPVCGARSRHSSGAARHPYAPPKDHNLLQQRRIRNSSGGGILAHSAPHSPLIDDLTHGVSILQQHLTGNVSHSDMRRRHLSAGHSMHHHNQQINQYSGSVVMSNKPVEQFTPVPDFPVNQQLFSVSEVSGLVEGPDNRPQSVPLPDMLRNSNFSQSVPSTPLLHHNQQPLMHQMSHDSALTQFQVLDSSNIGTGEKSHFNFEQSMPPSYTPTPVPSELSDFNTDNCLGNLSNFNNFDTLQTMAVSTSDALQTMGVSTSDVLQTMAESTSPITFEGVSVEDFVSTVTSCQQNTTNDSFMVGGDGFGFFNSSDNDSGSFINGNNNQLFSRNHSQSVNTSLPQNIFSPSDINQSNTFHSSSGTDITLNELNTTNLSDSSIGTSGLNLVDETADEVFNHQDINLVL